MKCLAMLAEVRRSPNGSQSFQVCRLSNALSCRLACTGSTVVVRISNSKAAGKPSDAVYAMWFGDHCEGSNAVEVSHALLHGSSIRYGDTVTVEVVPAVLASEVSVQPLSKFDWDVASTQGYYIENNLLRDVLLVAKGRVLSASLSSSLRASFLVTAIRCDGQQEDREVARLTNSTSLIVAPFNDTSSSCGSDVIPLTRSPALAARLAETSMIYPLRVLPQSHRLLCTGMDFAESSSSAACSDDSYLDALLGDQPADPVPWACDDQCTAYIHPLVLKAALDLAVGEQQGESALAALMSHPADQHWLGTIHLTAPAENSLDKPNALAKKLVVRVRVSDQVRPWHASLPPAAMRALGLQDYAMVRLALHINSIPTRLPAKILLYPVQWTNAAPVAVADATVAAAWVRHIEQHSHAEWPYLLSEGQIIPLAVQHGVDEVVSQDYWVQFRHVHAAGDALALDHLLIDLWQGQGMQSMLDMLQIHNTPLRSTLPLQVDVQEVHVLGFEDLLRDTLTDLSAALQPAALLRCLQSCICPPTALLLCGGAGSGKTAVLRSVQGVVARNSQLLAHMEMLDGHELRELSIEKALTNISECFDRCQQHAPSMLCVDNLDALCGSTAAGQRDEKAQLLAVHLHRCMAKARGAATRGCSHGSILLSACKVFAEEAACTRALSSMIYVLATATSIESIDPGLVDGFGHCIHIPTLSNRVEVLTAALRSISVPVALTSSQADQLAMETEGCSVGDIQRLARAVRSTVCSRAFHGSGSVGAHLQSSCDDLQKALDGFAPSGTTSASSATSSTAWEDVGGYEEEKKVIVDTVRTPVLYRRLFASSPVRLPRALLLYGPPGCGKTLLARAAGKDFGTAFLSVRGPQLLNKYIGASEKAVRELFGTARRMGRPALIFFDEFEALAPRRGKDNTGVTDRIVNQLLTFIDGVEAQMGQGGGQQVFIIAASSRPDLIDPALLRPGRIENHVYIGLPSADDRAEVLKRQLQALAVEEQALSAVHRIAMSKQAQCMTAADVKAIVNTAYLLAAQDAIIAGAGHGIVISADHLDRALAETRPSISSTDLSFYDSIYKRFAKKKSQLNGTNGSNGHQQEGLADNGQKVAFK